MTAGRHRLNVYAMCVASSERRQARGGNCLRQHNPESPRSFQNTPPGEEEEWAVARAQVAKVTGSGEVRSN
ncbi:hypothetical protein PC116_g26960 [Phytophthora cactorum]|nr:hypothetical protein PC119_g19369 [Phytophthora cactorum]KAG4224586.1 hypothetical protein PC116_g26960 [Phytophthora cactorum]